jgi:hypothetical protein
VEEFVRISFGAWDTSVDVHETFSAPTISEAHTNINGRKGLTGVGFHGSVSEPERLFV